MKRLRAIIVSMLACLTSLSITACGNAKTNTVEKPIATTSTVEGSASQTDSSVIEEATTEGAQAKDIDKQEIRDILNRSLDDEKCFSAEYVRLWHQAAQVSEAGLWAILPGSIYVPKSITLDQLNIQSATKATGKITMIAVDFEDDNNKQVIPATIYLIKENGKWVIDDVDDTKNGYRECIKNGLK